MKRTLSVVAQSIRIILSGYLLVSFASWILLVLNNVFSGHGPESAYNPMTPLTTYFQFAWGLVYLAPVTAVGIILLILSRTTMLQGVRARNLTLIAIAVIVISAVITTYSLSSSTPGVSGQVIFLSALGATLFWVIVGIFAEWLFVKRNRKK